MDSHFISCYVILNHPVHLSVFPNVSVHQRLPTLTACQSPQILKLTFQAPILRMRFGSGQKCLGVMIPPFLKLACN